MADPLREFRLDRLVRGFELTSALDYNVVLATAAADIEPYVREFIARACQPGLDVRVRWIAWAGLDATTTAIESLMAEQGGERRILIIDLSPLRRDELVGGKKFAERLNVRRDPFGRRFVGTFLLALPAWLEQEFATAAPDLWSVMTTIPLARSIDLGPRLDAWWNACEQRFGSLIHVREDAERRYEGGTMTAGYVLELGERAMNLEELEQQLARVPGYTGWRPWWVRTNTMVPQQRGTVLECWMFGPEQAFPDPAHSDFWRAEGHGSLFLVRGYAEDSTDSVNRVFSPSLAITRSAELLLHAHELCRILGVEQVVMRIRVRWSGLRGRMLTRWPERATMPDVPALHCDVETASAEVELVSDEIVPHLADAVEQLVAPIFAEFGGYRAPSTMLAHNLDALLERRV